MAEGQRGCRDAEEDQVRSRVRSSAQCTLRLRHSINSTIRTLLIRKTRQSCADGGGGDCRDGRGDGDGGGVV